MRDQFTAPFSILEGVGARVIEIAITHRSRDPSCHHAFLSKFGLTPTGPLPMALNGFSSMIGLDADRRRQAF
jgi:hypothetical protein